MQTWINAPLSFLMSVTCSPPLPITAPAKSLMIKQVILILSLPCSSTVIGQGCGSGLRSPPPRPPRPSPLPPLQASCRYCGILWGLVAAAFLIRITAGSKTVVLTLCVNRKSTVVQRPYINCHAIELIVVSLHGKLLKGAHLAFAAAAGMGMAERSHTAHKDSRKCNKQLQHC